MSFQFTVVTPSYQGLHWLKRCIGSVRGQGGVSLEHLIVDGGSDDGTVEFLEELGPAVGSSSSGSGEYRVEWSSGPDGGMYDAINKGWSAAGGGVLSWLNVDEQYLPGTLAYVREAFGSRPDVDVLFGDTIVVGPSGAPLAARREMPLRPFYLRNGFLYALSCATFFRRRLLDSGLLSFDEAFRYAGDFDLMLRLIARGVKVAHVPKYLSLFGVDGANLSVTGRNTATGEEEKIRDRYGALPKRARHVAMIGRYVEKLARGCYRRDTIQYSFALDQRPTYRYFPSSRVGSRFTYDLA